jgi:uncharacterized membrane protein (Fun14 family)
MKDYIWKPWKIGAVAVAALVLVAGGAMALFGGGDPVPTEVSESTLSGSTGGAGEIPGAKGFSGSGGGSGSSSPGETAEPAADLPPEGSATDLLSPALVRGGISFFAAFALAFALRSFLKLFVIFAGVWVASLFFLASMGWIEVHWTIIDDQFVGWTHTLGAQFKSMSSFVTGSLPSAGLAGLGLVAGLKKG